MSLNIAQDNKNKRWLAICIWLVIAIGAFMRLAMLLQNRNLFIDEANVARNIYERTFAGLAMPLSYEQYAPPVFLWIIKLCTTVLGFGEYALRLYPLVAGILALYIFTRIMKALGVGAGVLYPLFLMATGFIYIHFSTEVKQYMPDACIALILVYLALKVDVLKNTMITFVAIWTMVGTIAIWSSMPAVFMLAAVGVYYGCQCIQAKDTKKLMPVVIVGIIWLMQFLYYYITILKPEADSSYLHNYHKDYFLTLSPMGYEQLKHNMKLLNGLLAEAAGVTFLATVFNLALMITGACVLLKKHTAAALLLLVPVVAVIAAAAADQFSLIPRVSLFIMPVFLLLIGYGFAFLIQKRKMAITVILVAVACICAKNHSDFQLLKHPWSHEDVTAGMQYLQDKKVAGSDVFVHGGAVPAFTYYTQIHPRNNKWQQLKYANIIGWSNDCGALVKNKQNAAFLYAHGDDREMERCRENILYTMVLTDSFKGNGCSAYIYRAK